MSNNNKFNDDCEFENPLKKKLKLATDFVVKLLLANKIFG